MVNVFTSLPKDFGACTYYRIYVPFRALEKVEAEFAGKIDAGESSPRAVADAFTHADVAVTYQPVADSLIESMDKIKKFMPNKRPALVIDSDDNLFAVSPYNATYKDLGITRPDGSRLRKGDSIMTTMGNGAERLLWRDGSYNFNVVENWYRLEAFRGACQRADLVTCSTAAVARAIKRECGEATHTFVSPNYILFEDYDPIELREHPGEVRILWQGSDTHAYDLFNIRESVIKIAKKYPHTKWIFWGADYVPIAEPLGDQYRYLPWIAYPAFKIRLGTIGHDINLCPLATDHAFEECRSAIKWYESSSISRPAATIAQNTGDFSLEIQDGVTGMLYNTQEEFEDKLSELIENETKRKELASNARDWVSEHRDAHKHIHKLWEAWTDATKRVNAKGDEVSADHSLNDHVCTS